MPSTQNQRDLRRRQRRVRKLRGLKVKLTQTQDTRVRRRILEKIRKLSPWDSTLEE
jgi:hypothetical protein